MSVLSDEFEKWWKAVSNDEHVPVGIEDRHVARLAWKAAIAADRAARAELVMLKKIECVDIDYRYVCGWNDCLAIMLAETEV